MSTILNTDGQTLEVPKPYTGSAFRCAIVAAKWNAQITDTLLQGAVDTLHAAGVDDSNISILRVPGTVELVSGARMAIDHLKPDAVITLGCVIRGDTAHFDYVCMSATQGVTTLNAEGPVPVIFGVLTVDNLQQALDRAGGCLGNKGSEAAVAAIEMASLNARLTDQGN